MTVAVELPPLTTALDPTKPYSLVSLSLDQLPVEVVGSPVLRRLKLVKTLSGEHGLATEVQQFQEKCGTGVRSIAAAIQEFNLPPGEAAVLQALEKAAAFDIASRRLALLRVFRDDPVRRQLLENCAALRLDHATRQATEALTQKYTQALFANVFTGGPEGIRTVAELVARLNQVSAHADPAERKRAHAHILNIQQRFQLNDVSDILPFLSDFELLVTAMGYYRQGFVDLVPYMRNLESEVQALSPPDSQMISAMLASVGHHLSQAVIWIERFFQAFDASFDDILSTAQPQTFKQLQENLQRAYGTIGALLCAWGLRIQALHAFTHQQRTPPRPAARIDMIREVVCKHLTGDDFKPEDLGETIDFLRSC
jgi:hypothetical protein